MTQTIEFITVHTSTSYLDALSLTARQCKNLAQSSALKHQFRQQEQQMTFIAQGLNAVIKTLAQTGKR